MKIIVTPEGAQAVTDEEYEMWKKDHANKPPTRDAGKAALAVSRFEICKVCEETLEFGHACRWYKGNCFGCWRTAKESKCPHGKW